MLCLPVANTNFSLISSSMQLNPIHLQKINLLTFADKIKKNPISCWDSKHDKLNAEPPSRNDSIRITWRIWLVLKISTLTTKTLKNKKKDSFKKVCWKYQFSARFIFSNKKISPDRAEIRGKNSIIKTRELVRIFSSLPQRYSCNKSQIKFPKL